MANDASAAAELESMQSAPSVLRLCMDFAKRNAEINCHYSHLDSADSLKNVITNFRFGSPPCTRFTQNSAIMLLAKLLAPLTASGV